MRWPQPAIRAIGLTAGLRARNASETSTTPAPPSVIWLQSNRRIRPSTGGFAAGSPPGPRSGTFQPRVWALGLTRALAKLISAIRVRCASSMP